MGHFPSQGSDIDHQPPWLKPLGGLQVPWWEPLASDASTRRFFRVGLGAQRTAVVMVYPPASAPTVRHHAVVFRWAQGHHLPVPKLFAELGECLVVEDLGNHNSRNALKAEPETAQEGILKVLAAFQAYRGVCTLHPPFDESLFSRELQQFLDFAGLGKPPSPSTVDFLRHLAQALTTHPYRLCHRDFHLDNLMVTPAGIKAVDFQDLRMGPDTYDAASLLRERGGSSLFSKSFVFRLAEVLGWPSNWQARFLECAAQRGLKALGTFLKLVSQGRQEYRDLIPEVASNALEAVTALDGPRDLSCLLKSLLRR